MRTFPEAPIKLEKMLKDGKLERIFNHPFLELVNTPNEAYTYETLIAATMLSWTLDGNAYWLKVRNAMGRVIQLWYMPHWMVTPKGHPTDTSIFISHYDYNPNGNTVHIAKEDVVHFRFGLDPRNTRCGLSPIGAILREIFTDDESSNYSASLLKNMGVAGMIISPVEKEVRLDKKRILEIKEQAKQSYTGDKRGDAMVMNGAVKIDILGLNPKDMDISFLRNVSEERVTAAIGIPAAIAGFGSGLETATTNATIRVLKKLAWEGNIIPSQRIISQTMQMRLLPDFDLDKSLVVGYDNSNVQALQEDKDARVKRLSDGVPKGWVKVKDVREAEGLAVEDSDNVYLRPLGLIPERGDE
jgi:HK97 family phage portal protein